MPFEITVCTWNIYYGKVSGRSLETRLEGIVQFACSRQISIICLQEIPTSFIDNAQSMAHLRTQMGSNYNMIYMPEISDRSLASTTGRILNYLIIYNTNQLAYRSYEHFMPQSFTDGSPFRSNRLRCPILVNFTFLSGTNVNFSFFTWHNEVNPFASQFVHDFFRYVNSRNEPWILAGDLNVPAVQVEQRNGIISSRSVAHNDNSIDLIITSVNLRVNASFAASLFSGTYNPFVSDTPRHLALFTRILDRS